MQVQLNVVGKLGIPERISVNASTVAEAQAQAERAGYALLAARNPLGANSLNLRTASSIDVLLFAEQLRDLLSAGLSVIESLTTMRRSGSATQPVLELLERSVSEGQALSAALERSAVFPALLVAMVRASELTSDLPLALDRYAEHERSSGELRHRLVATAIYPLLLLGVGTGVLLFLLFYVMPRFARIFEGMRGDLPWSADVMIAWSRFLQGGGIAWVLVAFGALGVICAFLVVPGWRQVLLGKWMRLGPVSRRLRGYFLARWYRTTGMLIDGGIAFAPALDLSNVVLPAGLAAAGFATAASIRDGLSPADAYTRTGMATPVAEQLLRAGEKTGDIGTVLGRIAHFHEVEAARGLERVMRVVEPVVMAAIGLVVGTIVVLMYLPIFELASSIQ